MPKSHHDSRHHNDRKRSRSPDRGHAVTKRPRSRDRGDRDRGRHSHPAQLPFQRPQLHKDDLTRFTPLFAEYLDIQKQLDLADLSPTELRGRWKSFLGKWNRGELATGWYDPAYQQRAEDRYAERSLASPNPNPDPASNHSTAHLHHSTKKPLPTSPSASDTDDPDAEALGPSLPTYPPLPPQPSIRGPSNPTFADLAHRDALLADSRASARAATRLDRAAERAAQNERAAELAPRADAGTRERRMEKRAAETARRAAAREARSPGLEDVGEGEALGGGGEDGEGGGGWKAQVKARERVKNEREIRREEALRARAVERKERLAEWRRKEEGTMGMLRELARRRYGEGGTES